MGEFLSILSKYLHEPETEVINHQLLSMYKVWFENINNSLKDTPIEGYSPLQLLTCFDPYLKNRFNKKVIFYGKEANTKPVCRKCWLKISPGYQEMDEYYSLDIGVLHGNPKETQFLRTRKRICGVGEGDKAKCRFLSALPNNLNKTSYGGKYTPRDCSDPVQKAVYSDFTYGDLTRNVFIHEMNILRPTHLVFISGKGYDEHIKQDFTECFFKKYIDNLIGKLQFNENPVVGPVIMPAEDIKEFWGIENYSEKGIEILYAYHPSAHFKQSTRDIYNDKILEYVTK